MGLRFRKTVKLSKGSKVNIAKTGLSVSLGGRGHSLNLGKNGPTATVGIPGTGLSYRQKIGSTHSSHKNNQKPINTSSPKPTGQIEIHMNEKGHIVLFDSQGKEITDQSIIRKIQATPQFAQQKAMLELQRKEKINEMVEEANAENEAFINIYKMSPIVGDYQSYVAILENLKPEEYQEVSFDIPKPTEEEIRELLTEEAKNNVKSSIFTVGKMRKKYIEDNFDVKYKQAIEEWEKSRDTYYGSIEVEKKNAQILYQQEYEDRKSYINALIAGDEDIVSEEFDFWISECVLPVEININYEYNKSMQGLMLDVDLPEIEDIPTTILTKTDAGNLKEKKKTQAELKQEYSILTLGLAIFISANAFNISPSIKNILISGYTQRRDSNGNINDDYIYSIKFKRESFEGEDLSCINPKDFCFASENRCNLTASSLFKTITPYESL